MTFSDEHLLKMKAGIERFNDQLYWECHEELEHIWLEEPSSLRNVYWAVIQVAACLVHYQNENVLGARGLLRKSKEKFKRVDDMGIRNDILEKYLDWSLLTEKVFSIDEHAEIADFQDLYQFRFSQYPY